MSTTTALPSRSFLVQQSTLTALHETYPNTVEAFGRKHAADRVSRLILSDFSEGRAFVAAVRSEFRALTGKFAA